MMDSLRTAANSLVLKIIFGIIIVSYLEGFKCDINYKEEEKSE